METVLITGASSGIGRALAIKFAADGSDIYLVARDEEKLEEVAADLRRDYGTVAVVLPCDLSQPHASKKLADDIVGRGLEVDVLVNNAGFGLLGDFVDLDAEAQADMIRVNVNALTELTRHFLPAMIARQRGGVLNVSSVAAYQAGPRMAVYYATKAFVTSFTEAIREEVSGHGVHVSCLTPGATETEFGERSGMGTLDMFKKNAMSVEAVAEAGYRGFRKDHATVIPGWSNKLLALIGRLFPRTWTRKFVGWSQQPPKDEQQTKPGESATT